MLVWLAQRLECFWDIPFYSFGFVPYSIINNINNNAEIYKWECLHEGPKTVKKEMM